MHHINIGKDKKFKYYYLLIALIKLWFLGVFLACAQRVKFTTGLFHNALLACGWYVRTNTWMSRNFPPRQQSCRIWSFNSWLLLAGWKYPTSLS